MDFHLVIDALTNTVTQILAFIPHLINGLVVLIVGYVVAWIVRWLLRTVLGRLRFDALMDRAGISGSLHGLGIQTPLSVVVAQAVFALLLLSFLISATQLMGLGAVATILKRFLSFLPNFVAALIVFLLGGIVARFLGDLIATVAAAEGLTYAPRLGRIVRYLVSIFVAVIALSTLGLDTALLVTAVTIMIAAFGLALSLALGLGMRQVVFQVMAGYYMRQRFPAGQRVTLGQVEGEVSAVGAVNTSVTNSEGTMVVPNGLLFESLVHLPPTAAPETPPAP